MNKYRAERDKKIPYVNVYRITENGEEFYLRYPTSRTSKSDNDIDYVLDRLNFDKADMERKIKRYQKSLEEIKARIQAVEELKNSEIKK